MALPSAVDDTSTGSKDVNQTISPLTNDQFETEDPVVPTSLVLCGIGAGPFTNPCTAKSFVVPDEGTYTVNSNGTVTFDPLPTFVGTATPITYQVFDEANRSTTATITPTVNAGPTANPDTSLNIINVAQTIDPLSNDTTGDPALQLDPTSVKLCGSGQTSPTCTATSVTVSVNGTSVGTYSVNATTGLITFTPAVDWFGTPPPVTYQVADSNGQVASSTYSPTVIPPPNAEDDTSSGPFNTSQTLTPLSNDTAGSATYPLDASTLFLCGLDQLPNRCNSTSVTVVGEGTYTLLNGTVTFTPTSTFSGTVDTPITYQVADTYGQFTHATITPTVVPLPEGDPDISSGPFDTDQSIDPFDNDTFNASRGDGVHKAKFRVVSRKKSTPAEKNVGKKSTAKRNTPAKRPTPTKAQLVR
jgi:CshA-type fibril repeat protein